VARQRWYATQEDVHEQTFVFNAPKESKSGSVALVLYSTKHGLIGILSTAEAKACVSFFKGQTAAGWHLWRSALIGIEFVMHGS
jgi:hypothetical protein